MQPSGQWQPQPGPPYGGQQQYGPNHPGPAYPGYQAPPPPPRRSFWPIALIASVAVLVITVVSIVVVTALRSDENRPGDTTGAPSADQGPVDTCLVGRWRQTEYQRNVVLGDTEVGKRENLGTIKMTGSGKQWTIKADGSATEDDANTVYTGKTPDGRSVTAKFSGTTEWTLETRDGKIYPAGKSGNASVTITVDSVEAGRIDLQPNADPSPYSCTGDVWRTTVTADAAAFSTYSRVAG